MGALAIDHRQFARPKEPLKAIVLDDDAFDRRRLKRWIDQAARGQIDLVETASLEHFSRCIENQQFDIALIDYALPDGTGLDAIEKLREQRQVPSCFAVVVSGFEKDGLLESCMSQGCDRFLTKDALKPETLAEVFSKAAAKKESTARQCDTALEFWRLRAEERARIEGRALPQEGMAGDLAISERAVIKTDDRNATTQSEQARMDAYMSDFLKCDEFDFMNTPLPADKRKELETDPR